jgi:hypothetical protein
VSHRVFNKSFFVAGTASFLKGGVVPEEKIEYRGEEPPTSFVQSLQELRELSVKQDGLNGAAKKEAQAETPKTEDKPKKEKKQDAAPASTETDIS